MRENVRERCDCSDLIVMAFKSQARFHAVYAGFPAERGAWRSMVSATTLMALVSLMLGMATANVETKPSRLICPREDCVCAGAVTSLCTQMSLALKLCIWALSFIRLPSLLCSSFQDPASFA